MDKLDHYTRPETIKFEKNGLIVEVFIFPRMASHPPLTEEETEILEGIDEDDALTK